MASSTKGTLMINIISASELVAADSNGLSDPYVIVHKVGEKDKKQIFKTKIIKKTLNPVWKEEFKLPVTIQDKIVFIVKDWDRFSSDDPLGNVEVVVETLLTPPNTPHPLTLTLKDVPKGKLHVELMFVEQGLESEIPYLTNTKFFKSVNAKLDRDYILIVDKSGSMAGARWDQAQKTVSILAPSICKADPDGITLYLFSHNFETYKNIKNAFQVDEIFTSSSPFGSTDLAAVLKAAFSEHFSRKGNQTTILVVTDGEPNSTADGKPSRIRLVLTKPVEKVIKDAAKKLSRDEDLSVTFVQIGNDSSATRFLKHLDDNLEAKFDIVDTVTAEEMAGMPFEDLIAKSIND